MSIVPNLDEMTDEQKLAVLESVQKSIAESKEIQKRKIGENVELVVQALKKIESDIRDRFDGVGTAIEKRVASIKDGRDGANGKDGRDGKDGKSGRDGLKGDRGVDGQAGRDGVDGVDGVSVVNANIDFDGSLIISLSDGREINVGEVVSQDVAEKIRVISTMSTNAAIAVKEEGTTLTNGVKSINFVGTGITATTSGDDVTVTVSSGSGTVTSVTGTSPVVSSGGATPAISLAASYGDTQNPYASKTANFVLAAPNGSAGVPTFRAVVTADIPTLNQNTSGTAAGLSATLVATSGGTGQSSYAVGDLLYASTTTALSKLADVATGNALISGGVGVAPSWGKVGLTTHVSGTLPVANGGTNLTSFTANGVVYASSTSALATGSALVFDGTNLGVGFTPSAWKSSYRALAVANSDLASATSIGLASFSANAYLNASDQWIYKITDGASRYQQYAGIHSWYTAASGTAGNAITFTQAMTLDASGNLKVGTTSSANAHILQTDGSGIYSTQFISSTASSPYGSNIYFSGVAPNGTSNQFLYCNDSSALRMEVRSNGGIANYSANNVNLSDRREKTNFAPAKSYLDVICAIPVQTFNYIDQNIEDDAGLTLGVVAQDVQAVAPELVMESNWGTEEEPKMRLSIYQTDLQYALMKCIQEQQALITTLTARITALESA